MGDLAVAGATDWVSALSSAVSAFVVLAGAGVAYWRYRKDHPYFARANLELSADLLQAGDFEVVRVTASATCVGKGTLQLESEGCFVAVQAYRRTMLGLPDPQWTDVLAAQRIFKNQTVDSGEAIDEACLVSFPIPAEDVIAYRVEFGLRAIEPVSRLRQLMVAGKAEGAFDWTTSTFLTRPREGQRVPHAGRGLASVPPGEAEGPGVP
ncbi:MAG TPA: hypothetical protein VFW71_12340 [Actinomycetota bacterium]|nr:hypothetical protein [Actinomycetota bacterium]